MLVFGRRPGCSAVTGERVELLMPFVSVGFVFGFVVGLSALFVCFISLSIKSKAKLFTFRLSPLMLYLRFSSCCKLVLSLKNSGGLADG